MEEKKAVAVEIATKQIEEKVMNKEESKQEGPITESTEFFNLWKHIKTNVEACESLLVTRAKPESFPSLFKQGVDFDFFLEMAEIGEKLAEK
jgi:hypothetical protein